MRTFVWTIAVLTAVDIGLSLWSLAAGFQVPRTTAGAALNAAAGVAFLVWCAVLLTEDK